MGEHAAAGYVLPALRLVVLLPLLGAVINGLVGRALQARFGKRAVWTIALGASGAAAAIVGWAFVARLLRLPPEERLITDVLSPLLHIGKLHIDLALAMDPLSGLLCLVITWIGFGIHVYATAYMEKEESTWRFFACLNLFLAAMLVLVLGDSLLVMFFGWEGVGLASYLLIGFWYGDPDKANAARKAFVVNRIGDLGLVLGMAVLFWALAGEWSGGAYEPTMPGAAITQPTLVFRELAAQLADPRAAAALSQKTLLGVPVVLLACLGFALAAAGKSAQTPLFVWLPDAMAGPTPVSALIHAATMVTAGVYLTSRMGFLFALSPAAMTVIAVMGATTAFIGAAAGLVQTDLKRVLAYSTVSQLGFMFIGVGSGAFWAGAFHLLTHACFKACLFLGAGSVLHGVHHALHGEGKPGDWPREVDPADPQDMRNLGGLAKIMPHTRLTFLIACCAIAGFPFAAGFYSKDEILWRIFSSDQLLLPWLGKVIWAMALCAAGGTAFYMFRAYFLVFFHRAPPEAIAHHAHESPRRMTFVLWALAGLSIVVGAVLGFPAAISHHAPVLEHFLEPVFTGAAKLHPAHGSQALELGLMALSVGVATAAALTARALYRTDAHAERLAALAERFAGLHRLLYGAFGLDVLFRRTVVPAAMGLARASAALDRHGVDGTVGIVARLAVLVSRLGGAIDRYLVDGAVNGTATVLAALGRAFSRLQNGHIQRYAALVALGAAALCLFALLGDS